MRIGIDARFYGTLGKGLGRYTAELITALESLDSSNEYWIFLRRANFSEYHPASPRFHKVVADYPWYGFREQLWWPWVLLRYRFDLMHFPHFNVPVFYYRRFVVTIHDLILLHFPTIKATQLPPFLYWVKYALYRGVITWAAMRAQSILTVSQFTADDLRRVFPWIRDKVTVTPEGVPNAVFWHPPEITIAFLSRSELLSTPDGQLLPYVLVVGNAYPHKNLECVLTCARHFPQLIFVCVGKTDYFFETIERRAADLELKNMRFPGFVPDTELALLYRHAALYLFPSHYEGFGLPALEAAAHGVPVVANKCGALLEVLGDAALFFDARDVNAGCEAIATLLDPLNEHRRRHLIQRGFERLRHFSWKHMARQTLALYERIGKTHKSSHAS